MAAGRLRDMIDVVKQSETKDKFGGKTVEFAKDYSVRCNIKVLAGSELIKSGAQLGTEYVSVFMRYDKRLNYTHHMEHRGKRYTVEVIRPDDKYQYMTVTGSREIRG